MLKVMLICAPVTSRSGYGAHARDLVKSFMDSGKFNIKILDVNWGDTPRNALDKNNPSDRSILDCILKEPKMDSQPDVYVDIRIPNEFQTYGKFNIGITAGIETNAVSQKWLEGCNKMDLIIVPSEHSKAGFVNSIFDKIQQLPDGNQQKVGEVKLEKPIEVLFEGADEDIYKPLDDSSLDLIDDIKEDFCYLMVGQWGKGAYGEDRKDIGTLIKTFYETFGNKKEQPALILKTNGATYSIMDKEECLKKINSVKSLFPSDWKLPNIYLLHGSLSDDEMNKLYNHPKVKGMVLFTHGEGFGRPLSEASMVGLPIISTNWSGHIDFLNGNDCILLGGKLKQVPKTQVWKDIIIEQSNWFYVDETEARNSLTHMFNNYEEYKKKASILMNKNRKTFTLKNMSKKLNSILDKVTENMPTQVGIQLPKLKRVSDNSQPPSPKIELPKLKKVTETV